MSRQPRAWQGDARAWLRSKVGYHIRCQITEARLALRQHTTAEVNLLISLELRAAAELPRPPRPADDVAGEGGPTPGSKRRRSARCGRRTSPKPASRFATTTTST